MAKLPLQPFVWKVGETSSVDYNRWLNQLEAVYQFNNLNKQNQAKECIAILMSMGGDDVVDTITNKFDDPYAKTFAEIKTVLDQRFGGKS